MTNGISAITTAHFNGSSVVVLGGRAPDYRWGSGSLQEFDHPALLGPITKRAWTEHSSGRGRPFRQRGIRAGGRQTPRAGLPRRQPGGAVRVAGSRRATSRLARTGGRARRPRTTRPTMTSIAGDRRAARRGGAAGARARLGRLARRRRDAARAAAEELQLPVIANGQGRGILPAGHELLVTRARSTAFGEADLVIVVGTPLDFRLGYGEFGGKDGEPARRGRARRRRPQPDRHAPPARGVGRRRPDRVLHRTDQRGAAVRPDAVVGAGLAAQSWRRLAKRRVAATPGCWPATPTRSTRCGSTASSPRCSNRTPW